MQYLFDTANWKKIKKLGLKEHLQDDSFEEFMRNKLNEFDGEPNDNMWDRVENVIPPAPKPMLFRVMEPSSIAASIFLAVAALAIIYQYNFQQNLNDQLIEANDKIKQLEHKIDKNYNENTAQLEESNKLETIEEAINNNDNIQDENDAIGKNKLADLNKKKITNNKKSKTVSNFDKSDNSSNRLKSNKNNNASNQSSSFTNDKNKTPIANDIVNPNEKNNGSQKPLNNNKSNKTPIVSDNKPENLLNTIDNEPKDKLEKQNTDIAFGEPFLLDRIRNDYINSYAYFVMVDQKPTKAKPIFDPRWVVGGFTHAFQTKPEFRERPGPPPPGGNPFKDHRVKPATGLAIGAKIGLQLNKNWSINTGLAYQQEKIEMKLVDRHDYRNDRERDIGNNQESYGAYYTTHSPFGEIRVDGKFTKDKDDNIENKPIDIEIDGTHQLTSLNIPLYLQVQNQKGRLVYGLKAGVYGRKIINNSFDANAITSSITELKASEVVVVEQPEISHKWTADFLGGIVLGYKLNNNMLVSVEPTALMSLGNKHESQYGRTKMKTFGSQLAVQYTF